MENLRNKTQENVINKQKTKEYLQRFTKLNVYSYTKPNDNKVYVGSKPTEVYSLFNGNTSSNKKAASKEFPEYTHPDEIVTDQSTLQYYIILALQDFYYNYYMPLSDELARTQSMVNILKKKNDERFEVLTRNLEALAYHMSTH